jgi:hypothetical protein
MCDWLFHTCTIFNLYLFDYCSILNYFRNQLFMSCLNIDVETFDRPLSVDSPDIVKDEGYINTWISDLEGIKNLTPNLTCEWCIVDHCLSFCPF